MISKKEHKFLMNTKEAAMYLTDELNYKVSYSRLDEMRKLHEGPPYRCYVYGRKVRNVRYERPALKRWVQRENREADDFVNAVKKMVEKIKDRYAEDT